MSNKFSIAVVSALILFLIGIALWSGQRRGRSDSDVGDVVSSPIPYVPPTSGNGGASIVAANAANGASPAQHALEPVLQIARDALQTMLHEVRDYTALLVKRERVGGRLSDEIRMEIKVRNPQSTTENDQRGLAAYLRFVAPKSVAGREVIWVDGSNDNDLISHEAGFKNWTRMKLDPHGMLAMMGNKYPVTEIGLLRLVEKLIEKGEADMLRGPCRVDIVEDQQIGDRPCRLIQVTHPKKDADFDFHIAQIFIDVERNIPLRYAAFMWPDEPGEAPPLEEEYTYLDVKLNVGLTDADFDPNNPEYDFP